MVDYITVLSAEVNCELEAYTVVFCRRNSWSPVKNTMSSIVLYKLLHHCKI